jgi:hypothetical protein
LKDAESHLDPGSRIQSSGGRREGGLTVRKEGGRKEEGVRRAGNEEEETG